MINNIVLGGGTNALSVVRALGGSGSSYVVSFSDGVVKHSRFCAYFVRASQGDAFARVSALLSKGPAVLFPTDDVWQEFVSVNSVALRGMGALFYSNLESTVEVALDKLELYRRYRFSKELFVPETLEASAENLAKGWIVKPRVSFREANVLDKGFNANESNFGDSGYVMQRWLRSSIVDHFSVSGLSVAGKLKLYVVTRKIHEYPVGGGTATMIAKVEDELVIASLLVSVRFLLRELCYSGPFEAEFVYSDSVFWLIDINIRFWLQSSAVFYDNSSFPVVYRDSLIGCRKFNNVESMDVGLWVHEGVLFSLFFGSFVDARRVVCKFFSTLFSQKPIQFVFFGCRDNFAIVRRGFEKLGWCC